MRKLLILIVSAVWICSCKPEHPKDYISIAGKLENAKDTTLYITGFAVKKSIKINEDGSFQDSLRVTKPDVYTMFVPRNGRAIVYLDNGYDLEFSGNANEFFTSFTYEGNDEGAQTNNLLIDHYTYGKKAGDSKDFFILEKEAFNKELGTYRKGMDSIMDLYKDANAEMYKKLDDQNNSFFDNLETNYDKAHPFFVEQAEILAKLEKGKMAPEFNDYENYEGGTKSLKDFRGNFVYIDVWATWCRPCIAQIPYLKQLEKDLEGQNISIVSISTDDSRRSGGSWEKAHDKWAAMVKSKNLSGTQLWAGEDDANFSKNYQINSIPRFILIDPEGKIVSHNAMRPTDPKIKEYFASIGVK